jgi:hypothetical protein
MQASPEAPAWTQLIPIVVILVVVIIRMAKPQRVSVTRLWLSPLILCAVAAYSIYFTELLNPAPVWEIVAGLVIGAIAGIPFGMLRGRHTDVRPTDRPGVMYLGSSWITGLIFVGAFGMRYAIRMLMPHRGSLSTVIGDALLAFAIAYVGTSYLAIYRKYQAELAGTISAPPAPPAQP